MPRPLTWLPEALLAAGLKVALVPGWEERGGERVGRILGVICHYTGTADRQNMPTLKTLINGREDLPGPLCQLGLARDGTYYVVAAGRANHAGKGFWNGLASGNTNFIGIEAENAGTRNDPWPAVQMDAYHRGVAAILGYANRTAASCCGHREYALPAGRKTDPDFDMDAFRTSVAALLAGQAPAPVLIPAVEPGPTARPTLRRGMDSPFVQTLQKELKITPLSDHFGPQTEAKVREAQRGMNMVPDGIVGPKTWAAIDAFFAAKGRAPQIIS
ncbi:MAG: N-acetylmuramoyl-L-alanine amidase [Gemmatimonadota bacterium]|nr:N-acetylmuramoyl-L-alanine amidase [Gemmatimonadota bacterium]